MCHSVDDEEQENEGKEVETFRICVVGQWFLVRVLGTTGVV